MYASLKVSPCQTGDVKLSLTSGRPDDAVMMLGIVIVAEAATATARPGDDVRHVA